MTNAEDFAALVASRICHDLISPIGAIGNGVELLTLTGQSEGPEIDLIHDSAESASGRVRFFRIAFGAAPAGQAIAPSEILSILTARAKDGRIHYGWSEDGTIDRAEAKLVFLMILCAEQALPRGGRISVGRSRGGWTVSADADKITIEPDLWTPLSRGEPPRAPDASRIQFAALAMALAGSGRRLAVGQFDGRLTLDI